MFWWCHINGVSVCCFMNPSLQFHAYQALRYRYAPYFCWLQKIIACWNFVKNAVLALMNATSCSFYPMNCATLVAMERAPADPLTYMYLPTGAVITPAAPAGPEFVQEHSGNVTARVNGSVILNCRVRRLTARQVVSGCSAVLTGTPNHPAQSHLDSSHLPSFQLTSSHQFYLTPTLLISSHLSFSPQLTTSSYSAPSTNPSIT